MPETLSLLELRRELRALDRLDLDVENFENIKKTYNSLFTGVQAVIGTTSGAELFFRARKNPPQKPSHVIELGPPPPESITGFQRCNAPFAPMLYTSSKRITALKETRVKAGDVVYLSQWIGVDHLPVNKILDADEDAKFVDQLDAYNHIVHSHVDTIFTRRIHDEYSNDYKLSAALSELLTTNFQQNKIAENDGLIGLRYPSIFDKKGSYNTVFPGVFAFSRMNVMFLSEILIGQPDGSQMPIRILDTAVDFQDGKILWTGNPNMLPAPRENGGVMFRSNGSQWLAGVSEGSPTEINIHAFLNE